MSISFRNLDAEQEAQDEFQRSLRGTRMLDDEDCAHLDAVDRVREERDREVKDGIEKEVAMFRARREDRGLVQSVVEEVNDVDNNDEGATIVTKKEAKKGIVPKFIVKKKKRRQDVESNKEDEKTVKSAKTNDPVASIDQDLEQEVGAASTSKTENDAKPDVGGLLGLGCYGSDSD